MCIQFNRKLLSDWYNRFRILTPVFPGAFDQHGCPLIVFPVDEQATLSSELSKAEVVDFINYFLCLHKYVDSVALIIVCM